jgi:hypothetical protein
MPRNTNAANAIPSGRLKGAAVKMIIGTKRAMIR